MTGANLDHHWTRPGPVSPFDATQAQGPTDSMAAWETATSGSGIGWTESSVSAPNPPWATQPEGAERQAHQGYYDLGLRREAGQREAPAWAATTSPTPATTGHGTQGWEGEAPTHSSSNVLLDAEAEALLEEVWGSARLLWEQALVRMAMIRGQRDENQLTDLVFFRRHPERGGRPLNRSEPAFGALVAEWTAIRDTMVRPALRGSPPAGAPAGPAPAPSPAPPPAPSPGPWPGPAGGPVGTDPAWATRRQALVRIALEELAYWGSGSLKENQQRGWERVERYWMESVGWTPGDQRGVTLATGPAWSGVFISWVVAQAGIGRDLWKPWSNHSGYLVELLRFQARSGNHPIQVIPPYSEPLRPGDMVNNWRNSAAPYDLNELNRWVARSDLPTFEGHTDIVTSVVPGDRAEAVGGNKSDSVGRTTSISVDRAGVLVPRADWVAVIRMGS